MEEEIKCVSWENDQEDETKETKIVKAPNGKYYKIRAISAYEREMITDEAMKFQQAGLKRAEISLNQRILSALTLQKGVIEPDFSKHSMEEIFEWMKRKKDATVTFLTNEIGKLSGYSEEDVTFR